MQYLYKTNRVSRLCLLVSDHMAGWVSGVTLQCTLSQHHAIGLQTDCMVTVLAPVVRLLDSHVYALWP